MNTFTNAALAALYIVLIVFVMDTVTSLTTQEETVLIPMTILSLFVLSAAVMGFLFVYKPFQLYFEGHKQEAVLFFTKTVGVFACFTAAFIVALLLGAPR